MKSMPKHTKKLKEELEKIGFDLKFCGCEHYLIVNQKGRYTEFEIYNDTLSVRPSNNSKVFGCSGRGLIHFNLRCCKIEHNAEHNMTSVSAKSDGVFISFYGKEQQ